MAETQPFDEYLASIAASTAGVSMVPGLNPGGAVVRVPYSANGEVPADNGFFVDDDPKTQIHRFRDRIFFGEGSMHTGRRTAPLGGTWMTEEAGNYFEKNATVTILSDKVGGRAGLIAGSYTEAGVNANMNMAVGAISVHKGTTNNGRCFYAEAMHFATGGGTTEGLEIQVGNYSGIDPDQPTSYNAVGGAMGLSVGVEGGTGYLLGDGNDPLPTPLYPAVAAMRIGGGSTHGPEAKWRSGLIFMENSLYRGTDGLTGTAKAIQLAMGYEIEWNATHLTKGAKIRSDVTAIAGDDVGLIFTNKKVRFTATSSELDVFNITHVASSVNYIEAKDATTGVNPSLNALGSDATVGLTFIAKSTGQIRFNSHGSNSATNFAIVPPASAPVNFLTAGGGATGNPARVGASGSDTNVSIYVTPKGTTGEVRLLGGSGSTSQVRVNDTGIGFFGGAPVAKPTGVPVTAADIHAALVTLGLIAA